MENHEVELDPVAAGCLFHLLINNRQDMEIKKIPAVNSVKNERVSASELMFFFLFFFYHIQTKLLFFSNA